MKNNIIGKLLFGFITLFVVLSACLMIDSYANSVPAEFWSDGYTLSEYDLRTLIINGETRYNITATDLREEYAILCCQHGTALPSGDSLGVNTGLDHTAIDKTYKNLATVTNTTKDYYAAFDGVMTRTAAWYKVTAVKEATPEEAYILAEMILDTQSLGLELTWYTDANGNRVEVNEGEMDARFSYEIGGDRYFLYDIEYAVQTESGTYVVEYAGIDEETGKAYYKYKVKAGGSDYVKYNGDLSMTDPKFQIEAGSNYVDLDSFEYSFEGEGEEEGIVTSGKVYITSNKAAKYDEETGRYYTAYAEGGNYYVQQAWWASDANIGTKVVPNHLSKEAKAFEQYILRVTRSRNVAEVMSKYVEHPYELELNGTVYTGTVPAAEINYEPKYMDESQVANILGVDDEEGKVTVAWDENKQVFKIGPFAIDYVEERIHVENRDPVEFAGITDMRLYTNLGEVPADKWRFVYLNGYRSEDDDYKYPHEQEPFYIELDYIEGAIEITDLHTSFHYMNAGGKYERLEGVYNKVYWASKYKTNYCSGPSSSEPDENGNVPTCSHGYTSSHVESYTSWLDITKVEPTDSQLLASGLIGVRWYEETDIHLDIGPVTTEHKGKLAITKEITNSDDNINASFKFKIYIDGEFKETIKVKAGQTVIRTYEWEGDTPPSYRVEEIEEENDEFELEGIENASGSLIENGTVTVIAKNRIEEHSGSLRLDKIAIGEELQDRVFKFLVKIGRDTHTVEISAATGWSWVSPEYTWEGDNAPAFRVEEIDLDEDVNLLSILPATGTLKDDNTGNQVTVTAVNESVKTEFEHGNIKVTKKVDGNIDTNEYFTFKIKINGGTTGDVEYLAKVKAGSSYITPEIYWEKGTKAPTYEITEINIPDGWGLVEIQNGTGSLKDGDTVKVVAINEATEEHSGKVTVTKVCTTDEKVQDEAIDGKFTIQVAVTGTFEADGESVVAGTRVYSQSIGAGESFSTPEIKWYGSTAPTYTVTETNMPEGWTLREISNGSGSLEDDQTISAVVSNHFGAVVEIDLTIELGGIVWEDGKEDTKLVEDADHTGEGQYADGLYDAATEQGIPNVEVYVEKILFNEGGSEIGRTEAIVHDEEGSQMSLPIYTSTSELGKWKAPRVELGVTEAEKARGASYARFNIRFVYDGQTYEPTKALVTGSAEDYIYANTNNRDRWKNNSMALDIDRQEVNNRAAEIFGGNSAQGNTTNGYLQGTDGTVNDIEYLTTAGNSIDDSIAKSEVITLDDNGVALPVFKANATTEKAGLIYPFDDKIHLLNWDKYIDELGLHEVYHYSATYEYTKNINLGLVQRSTSDLALAKDLTKAVVVANAKMLTYRYNSVLDKLDESAKVAIESKNTVNGYTLNVYDTDYYYRAAIYESDAELYNDLNNFYASIGKTDATASELEIYLNYRILVLNNSQGNYSAEIKEIADYFDDTLTLITADTTAYVQSEEEDSIQEGLVTVAKAPSYTTSNGGSGSVVWEMSNENIPTGAAGTVEMKTKSLSGIKLARGEYALLDMTFKVNKETIDNVDNSIILGEKSNTAEIARYSIYDAAEGNIEGKIDLNSAPANINFDEAYYEDDTDAAPVVTIGKYETVREIDGLVFEDAQEESIEYDQVVGDGIYNEGEDRAIGDVPTTLVEKVTVPTGDGTNYKEYSFIWPTDSTTIAGLNGQTIESLTGFDSTTVSSNSGENIGTYLFTGVPAGNFAVQYTYGMTESGTDPLSEQIEVYNGQDFKTTSYQVGYAEVAENGLLTNEWHDLENQELAEDRLNDARDLEYRRLEVIANSRILQNAKSEMLATADDRAANHDELFNNYYMMAETAKLNLEVEDITSEDVKALLTGDADVKKLGGIEIRGKVNRENPTEVEQNEYNQALVYRFKNIDCGIEERSSTEIALDKQISNITITLSDATELANVNFDIEYEKGRVQDDGSYEYKAKVKVNKDTSKGYEQLQAVNKKEDKDNNSGVQNFRYFNIDSNLMQGAVISIEYALTALNIGEVDRIGNDLAVIETAEEILVKANELKSSIENFTKVGDSYTRNNNIGQYLGSVYYNGTEAKGNDEVVATSVKQLIDYVDNDAVFTAMYNMKENHSWVQKTEEELLGESDNDYANRLVSKELLIKDGAVVSLVDSKNSYYNNEQKTNIIVSVENDVGNGDYSNIGFMKELKPVAVSEDTFTSTIKLLTSKTIGTESDVDNMTFDNLAEIVKFENEVGRRDLYSIPGNADPSLGEFTTSLAERDQSATEIITLTPPTGANLGNVMMLQILAAVLVALVILAGGIVIIKKKVLTK